MRPVATPCPARVLPPAQVGSFITVSRMASFYQSNEAMAVSAVKSVLVLDGGCIRGLGCLYVLEELSKRIGEDTCETFDLICGSGCGGLLAILLGRLGMNCQKAISVYKKLVVALCGTQATHFHRCLFEGDGLVDSAQFSKALSDILDGYAISDMFVGEKCEDGTNTFVTTVHNNSNHVYQIRSYPAPSQTTFAAPPKGRIWSIAEAVKATFSCPFFMLPLSVEGRFEYSDGGFAGFNNPINQAYLECQRLWGSHQAITFVSLGTSLESLTTGTDHVRAFEQSRPLGWDTATYAQNKRTFAQMAGRFGVIARETRAVTQKHSEDKDEQRRYFRLDPPLQIPEAVLCDVYYEAEIRRSVNQWVQGNGASIISELLAIIPPIAIPTPNSPITLTREEMERKIREAHMLDVPKPDPSTVHPGYNLDLDKKRPTTIDEYLRRYHVLFVIDDSRSMKGKLWKEAQDALKKISDYAVVNQTAKIEVMFLNNPNRIEATQGGRGIITIFNTVSPQRPSFSVENLQTLKSYIKLGETPTGERLEQVLKQQIDALDAAVGTPAYGSIHPLDIIVITDGRPTDDPAAVMEEAVFVQVGNDRKAKRVLEALVHGDNGSMVDTVPYDGVLTPERLERILLGGLHPNVRALIL